MRKTGKGRRAFVSLSVLCLSALVVVASVASYGVILLNYRSAAEAIGRSAGEISATAEEGRLRDFSQPENYRQILDRLAELQERLHRLRVTNGVLVPLRVVPGLGAKAQETADFLAFADERITAARIALELYAPLVVLPEPSSHTDLLSSGGLQTTTASTFREAYAHLTAAKELRNILSHPQLISPHAVDALEFFDKYEQSLYFAIVVGRDQPEVLASLADVQAAIFLRLREGQTNGVLREA